MRRSGGRQRRRVRSREWRGRVAYHRRWMRKPPRSQHLNTLAPKHFQLVTLGRVALRGSAGDDAELGKRPRKLALLAVLALARRAPTRSELAEMFWGDEDEERARHSLSDALSHLRRVLGRDAIASRREAVELATGGRLAVDAVE